MKRISLILTCLITLCGLWASPRSAQQARQEAALHFLHASNAYRSPVSATAMTLHWTAPRKNGAPAFYVFNRGEEGGWVIISAEDRTRTVLAYATEGTFDEATLPGNARAWLNRYIQQIDYAASFDSDQEQTVRPLRKESQQAYTPVAPICTTQWGQGAPYNQLCPIERGERSVTGCVATAAAQLMKVHNYPTHGFGSHSYTWKNRDGDSTILSVDFANATYDWNNMIDNYRATSATSQQEAAVATLMYHCGVACDMSYTSSESSSNTTNMLRAMINHFGYDQGIQCHRLDYMSEETFVDSIAADLANGLPVYMNGRTINDAGHAFLCDGIDQDGLIHINWGWNGTPDAYYRVSVLNPKSQGIGGSPSGDAYTMQIQAFTHIQPNQGHYPAYAFTGKRMYFESQRISKSMPVKFFIDTLENASLSTWEGHLGILLYKDGALYNTYFIQNTWTLQSFHYFFHVNMYQYFSSLPSGQYELVPAVTTDEQALSYVPVMIKGIGECRCPMTVTNDSIFLSVPEAAEPTDHTGGWDPTTYTYTRMDNYFHDGKGSGGYLWKIQVGTDNFYSSDTLDTEALLLFTVQTGYNNSVLGSYLKDGRSTNKVMQATVYTGTAAYCTSHKAQSGECTIVYDSDNATYSMDYSIVLYNKTFVGRIVFPKAKVRGIHADQNNNYSNLTLDNTLYSGITTSQAVARALSQEENAYSLIPFAVQGEISQLNNTPAQMVQYKNCRLYISDGVTPIYSFNTKWLNNTAYSTGYEIAVGGKAVIVGVLQNYLGSTPEINSGYFCSYEAPQDQAIEQTDEESAKGVQKVIRHGNLLILRNGEAYTIQGFRVRD